MRINFKNLTVQVLIAIVLGIIVGAAFPEFGAKLKILADIFIKLIKMLIAPIIFLTVVIGIGSMGDVKKVGKIGGKALIYFEIVSTFALAIGLIVVNIVQPGKGFNTEAANGADVSQYTNAAAAEHGLGAFIMQIIPDNVVGALANGELLPVLFSAVLFGLAAAAIGEPAKPVIKFFEQVADIFFKIVNMVMKISPIGAFGAMSYTIGNFGLKSLGNLGFLMLSVYITMFIFIVVIIGFITHYFGFSIFKFIKYIKDEIFIVIGTSSSESALPSMMRKLENYGCSKQVVGLVIPTGYSFNLDGTSIYLSMAAIFIAQAYGVDLDIWHQITLLAILMLTSKGAAGVTGSGFITLAATLAAFPMIPVEGIALLIGVDRFMSEARAVTNLIGNGVATVVVSKMEKEFDTEQEKRALSGQIAQP
ncbi:dicarboxylate/amino acid:cation symporter [Lysinibacillus fusiformis]|uniref:dicarboxylate/amino acid:cation symporter n=1 Tax=Lysinibacillus fusiformis TaxID=28031 RepID=UPI0011BB50BD|nr:dicarboxylate/amino acid:cation symporter [Lysinibacillus fusiformis]MDC6267665.1 dicarboxylate/amino acid:cation symporter [Lysinibacillus sphaericus]KAB0443516.1 glutamate/aspartate:proton symporter GltP [Lysinibacillus fusiformis]MCT6926876.1 dicarboxylate/amino acid:cation symporter [Lysinibacillus fusiformis]MCT6931211.1 dicarboxylate/amino acid:cation symporter [Lysinibacillus fusiformis]MDN4967901.1 dicarboxylate/amino acid:cation symporter [Lysinibacillus fusiformis]